jgi:hypothetical protein
MQTQSEVHVQYYRSIIREGVWVTDKENEKIVIPLKIMNKNEVMNDLLKLLDLVQKHADKNGCQHCLDLLESLFATDV